MISLHGISLVFDLDGTLVDTARDLVRVTNEVIAEEGLGPTDYRLARRAVGFGSRRLITDALAREGHTISTERLDDLQRLFLEIYAADIARLSRPFDGVIETLKYLRAHGADLSVCTNKPGYLARPLLRELRMDSLFSTVVGGDEAPKAKPSPTHIWAAAGHQDPSRIVMFGDSYPDVRAAHNARVPVILMRYGYSVTPSRRLRADARLDKFRNVPAALTRLL